MADDQPLAGITLHLSQILAVAKDLQLEADRTIFNEGDEDENLYIILQGKVAITKKNAEQEDQVIATIGPGEFFGENMLVGKTKKPAGARTVTPAQLIAVSNQDFENIIKNDAAIGAHFLLTILKLVGERLTHMNEQLVALHAMSRLTHQYKDDMGELARATVERMLEVTASDAGAIFLSNPYSDQYQTIYTSDQRLTAALLDELDPAQPRIVTQGDHHYLIASLGDMGAIVFRRNAKKPVYKDDKLRLLILIAEQLLHSIEGAAIRSAKKAIEMLNNKRFSI